MQAAPGPAPFLKPGEGQQGVADGAQAGSADRAEGVPEGEFQAQPEASQEAQGGAVDDRSRVGPGDGRVGFRDVDEFLIDGLIGRCACWRGRRSLVIVGSAQAGGEVYDGQPEQCGGATAQGHGPTLSAAIHKAVLPRVTITVRSTDTV